MAQLTCPHCENTFRLDLSKPTDEIACPACGGSIANPSAPPSRRVSTTPSKPPVLAPAMPHPPSAVDPAAPPAIAPAPPGVHPAPTPVELVPAPVELVPSPVDPTPPPIEPAAPPSNDPAPPPEASRAEVDTGDAPAAPPSTIDPPDEEQNWNQRALRHYSSEQKASKRFVKNFIIWVICALVMILLMLVFLK